MSAPLTVIGHTRSINVRKVLWTCEEIGLHYRREDAGPDLAALNPNALVPVLRDGSFVLWESNTICRYLARPQRPRRPVARRAAGAGRG